MITTKLFVTLLSASFIYAAPPQQQPQQTSSVATSASAAAVPSAPAGNSTNTTNTGVKPTSTTVSNSTTVAHPTAPPSAAANATTAKYTPDMKGLFEGNKHFRTNAKSVLGNLTQSPSFMFFGCSDNRLSAGDIFNAPAGSLVSQTNVGNQYMENDLSVHASLAYAINNMKVQHIIVLGHYGCKGVEAALTVNRKSKDSIQKWISPINDIFQHSGRKEIKNLRDSMKPSRNKKDHDKPKANDPGLKALVEENVRENVRRLKTQSLLRDAYRRVGIHKNKSDLEVYVHGLVFNESDGEVRDLKVSFGPPGKKIPDVLFEAAQAAKNWHSRPSGWMHKINKGKTVTKTATQTTSSAAPTESKK